MLVAVADTHTVLWQIFSNPNLSVNSRPFINSTAASGNKIGISCITLVEIVYLLEKSKIPVESFTHLAQRLSDARSVFVELRVDLTVARALARVDAWKVPDMPDRIIAATALSLSVLVLSKDTKIQMSGIPIIW
jgi:PIN domain nuclease of toxin-antitoxin system